MKLIEDRWTENLGNLQYEDGYDIRLHAAQVALGILARRTNLIGAVNFSTVRFGYYDVNTEGALEAFQRAINIHVTRKLDRITYEKLFEVLRGRLNVVILEVGTNQLKISEITKDISDLLPDFNYPNNNDNEDSWLGDNDNSNTEEGFDNIPDIDWGDSDGDYYDPNNGDDPKDFSDDFWDSIKDGENPDDIFTVRTPDFGGGDYGPPFINRGHGEDYTDTNGYPSSGGIENNDFIDNLLSNSIYKGNFDYEKPVSWMSKSDMSINVDGFKYDSSDKHGTFFNSKNSSETRRSGYDITIVYGANSQLAKKLVDVRQRSRSQQIDASGEAIYDVIEFIANDVIETDNRKQ